MWKPTLVTANGAAQWMLHRGVFQRLANQLAFPSGSGSITFMHGCPATPIYELKTRSHRGGPMLSASHGPTCVPASSALPPNEVSEEVSEGGGNSVCVSCPNVERSPMVSPPTEPLWRPTNNAASSPWATHERAGKCPPLMEARQLRLVSWQLSGIHGSINNFQQMCRRPSVLLG